MNVLVLGKGKTGVLVADVARERGHQVASADEFDNADYAALTPEKLRDIAVVIDFTAPDAVMGNIAACARARRNMVVGTTGWYNNIRAVRDTVEKSGIGFVFGSNFSIGVNLFFEIARAAAAALKYGYEGHIVETHHTQKKDAPSGTAVMIRNVVEEVAQRRLDIESIREGDVVGTHTLRFDSPGDSITLTHEAKSRRGFATGAVFAAEWIAGKQGFYDFKDVFRQMGK
jgi:4-hydroxy-tetrahydrodipicolinate reductase